MNRLAALDRKKPGPLVAVIKLTGSVAIFCAIMAGVARIGWEAFQLVWGLWPA